MNREQVRPGTRPGRRVRCVLATALLAALELGCGGGGGNGPGGGPGSHGAAPAPKAELSGTPFSWDAYRVVVPTGMTAAALADAAVIDKPDTAAGGGVGCRIVLWPLVATGADPDAQALGLLEQHMISQADQAVVGVYGGSPLDETYHRNGISGEGWTYVELGGRLVVASNHNSEYGKVRILLANLGAQSAVITGFQPWDASSRCLEEVLDPYEWILLFYSLSFPSHPGNPDAFRQALHGGWFGAEVGSSVSIYWGDIFAANGRHIDAVGFRTYQQISPTEYLQRNSSWSGNSWWDVSGNRLSIWPDDPTDPPVTRYVRITAEHGGYTYLHRLDICGSGAYCEGWSTKDHQ